MVIEWTTAARKALEKIYIDTLRYTQSEKIAYEQYYKVASAANLLERFPQAGPLELSLETRPEAFRSLIANKHYKLIYILLEEAVRIVAVWDTRCAPTRLVRRIKP